jgi:hypothetical protein
LCASFQGVAGRHTVTEEVVNVRTFRASNIYIHSQPAVLVMAGTDCTPY